MTKLEVACFNEDSALIAAENGADRIELCADYNLGGITPQTGEMDRIKEKSNVPVYVMIRPRGGDFCYTDDEFLEMKYSIGVFKTSGADGFVFGILTKNNKVDIKRNQELIQAAEGLPCTFHRAFDRIENKKEALNQLIDLGFKTVLTSGGEHPAMEGLDTLKLLQKQAETKITILVGGGVRSHNVSNFKNDFSFVHSACLQKGSELVDLAELLAIKAALK